MMAEVFSNLAKDINMQIQVTGWTPERRPQKSMSIYIIIKLPKTKSKEKILKAAKPK